MNKTWSMCSIVRKTWLNLKSDTWLLYHHKISGLIKTLLEKAIKLKARVILGQVRECTAKRRRKRGRRKEEKGRRKRREKP